MKFNIQSKIVFPYTILFAVVIVATSLITIRIVHKQMDERIEGQMERMAEAISGMGFLMSDDFLSSIKINEVIGADIIVYTRDGRVTATSLKRDNVEEAMTVIRSPEVEEILSENKSLIRSVSFLGQPYKVIYRQLETPDEGQFTTLSLMASTADIAMAKRRSAITIGLVEVSGIFLVAVIGSIIAGGITAPVKQLVRITERIAGGDLAVEASVQTRDEIGMLANSFNFMTRELRISRDKLVQSEKLAAVGQIAAGIAHEIRNPLTSIKMIVQLLRRRFQGDEAGQSQVQAVLDEINRLEIIINSLLDFARPMELALKPVDITHIMNDVLNIMTADLRHRKIELITLMDETPPKAMLDADRMKQVFMNLILNSMQAMPEGGKLTIQCKHDEKGSMVQIAIIDTGAGMSQEVLDRVFEPFFSTKPGGTGLGLSIVKKIIDQHSGIIQLESKEGQGTKAIIKLQALL